MSAYVVDDNTINTVVSFLNMKARGDGRYSFGIRSLAELGYNVETEEDCSRLASDMFALNVKAVNERYGENQAEQFRPLDFTYRFSMPKPIIPTLKALECWRYQCSEGDVPQTELYKVMTDVVNSFLYEIVHRLPAYENAEWG